MSHAKGQWSYATSERLMGWPGVVVVPDGGSQGQDAQQHLLLVGLGAGQGKPSGQVRSPLRVLALSPARTRVRRSPHPVVVSQSSTP